MFNISRRYLNVASKNKVKIKLQEKNSKIYLQVGHFKVSFSRINISNRKRNQ